MSIEELISNAGTISTFFINNLTTLVGAVPFILVPAALMLIRASIKNAKSLLFYGKGRRGR